MSSHTIVADRGGMFTYKREYGGWEFVIGCPQKIADITPENKLDFINTKQMELGLDDNNLNMPMSAFATYLQHYRIQDRNTLPAEAGLQYIIP